jgi:hypothetical protein
MNETRAVKDLSIGARIQVQGFDDPRGVRSAKKVPKGADAGQLDVKLAGPDGKVAIVRFDPEEAVVVVGKDADWGQQRPKASGKGKGKGKDPADRRKAPKGKARRDKGKTSEAPATESASAEAPPPLEPRPEPAETDAPPVTPAQAERPPADPVVAGAPPAGAAAPADAAPADGTQLFSLRENAIVKEPGSS